MWIRSAKRMMVTATAVLSVAALLSSPAQALDWSGVKEHEVRLFYPGETSLEWIYSKRNHDGAAKYKNRKKTCRGCHDGDEQKYGLKIVEGTEAESKPLVGRRGFVPAKVQFAHDGTDIHVRVRWAKTAAKVVWPTRTDLEGIYDEHYDTKMTVMLDDGSIEEFKVGGCWAVCHADERQMSMGGNKRKYLAESRSSMHRKRGGEDNVLSDDEIANLISKGVFLEYWQAKVNPGMSVDTVEGTILKDREEHTDNTVKVKATEEGNDWVVEYMRPLQGAAGHKSIEPGKVFTIALALHDQSTAGRYHLTSLEFTMAVDQGDVDFVIAKH